MSRLNKGAAEQRFPLPALLQKLACVMAVALALVCAGAYAPTTAQALETAKITARPNTGSGSAVVGGTETRITWEVQADADEELSGLSLTFVDEVYGVTFPVEGGDEAFSGTYTLADGSTKKISKIPSVEIKGVTAFDNFLADLKEQPWVEAWNSNMFLRLFLNPVILVQSLPIVFKGFLMSLSIVLVAFPLAIPFGFALSLMRISKSRILRCLAGIYVNIIRGTPAFLQIYIAFFGLPLAGVKVDDYVLGVIVMAMNSSAYLCEIFRAGIQSIPKGQNEAARSLGMNAFQTLLYVMIPQTFRNVLPTLTSEFILLYKDTSLLAAVGVVEIVMNARTIVATTGSITPYVVAALFYLVITLPLARLVSGLEARLLGTAETKKKRPTKSAGQVVATPADHIAGL